MSKCTILFVIVLTIESFVCNCSCNVLGSEGNESVAPVFETRVAAPKSGTKDFARLLRSIDHKLDNIIGEMAQKTPDIALQILNPQVQKLEKDLSNYPLSDRVRGLLSVLGAGKSKRDKMKHDLSKAYMKRTVALHSVGEVIESLVELKKMEKLLRKTKSDALKSFPEIESSMIQRIKDTLNDNPKALFGLNSDNYNASELGRRYRKLCDDIDSLRMPKDATVRSVKDMLHKAYEHLS